MWKLASGALIFLLLGALIFLLLMVVSGSSFAASPSGTTIPPATQIIDSTSGTWTVDGSGVCYLNGVQAGGCAHVTTLLFYQGAIYANTTAYGWWQWVGNHFQQVAGDPRGPSPSPSGTTIPPATQITDLTGGTWTVDGSGVCYLNGVQAGGCAHVTTLLFYQGAIYANTTAYGWWQWVGNHFQQVAGDPRGPSPSPSGTTIPPATQITDLTGGTWTVDGSGVCYLNGVQAGGCAHVTTLLFYQGAIYA